MAKIGEIRDAFKYQLQKDEINNVWNGGKWRDGIWKNGTQMNDTSKGRFDEQPFAVWH
jgi:hypothetical protein